MLMKTYFMVGLFHEVHLEPTIKKTIDLETILEKLHMVDIGFANESFIVEIQLKKNRISSFNPMK